MSEREYNCKEICASKNSKGLQVSGHFSSNHQNTRMPQERKPNWFMKIVRDC